MVRHVLGKRLGVENNKLIFTYNKYGKPLLLGHRNIHFNISHSKDRVVCAVDDYSVGIDIELMAPVDLRIAKRFFSEEEYTSLINKPENIRLMYFYKLWTLKESYVKAKGKGLNILLNSFKMSIDNNNIHLHTDNNKKKYFFQQFLVDTNYILALCANNDKIDNRVYLSIDGLLQELENSLFYG